jgi:formylglycine-generating enzyme required for sulfatase activity
VQTGDASIATFTLDKDTKTITVTGVGVGTCIVSVYDSGTGETAEVEVTVTQVTQESTETKQTFTVNGVTFTMIKVDGGTFMMGSDDGDSNGKPVHQVTLSDYSIGETEVTQALWVAVMGNNPSEFKTSLQLPVESVEWADCQEFITKLNDLTGQTFRLPTEAEWEFAARGGNYSNGYKYSGSNNVDEVAWHEKNSTSTHEVAQKIPNEIGLYDMSGNVSEWCQDWKGDYSSSPLTNPTGLAEGTFRIERGGGWGYYPYAICCTTTYRGYSYPFAYNSALGLRLAQ